jgi:hypothetical protein
MPGGADNVWNIRSGPEQPDAAPDGFSAIRMVVTGTIMFGRRPPADFPARISHKWSEL